MEGVRLSAGAWRTLIGPLVLALAAISAFRLLGVGVDYRHYQGLFATDNLSLGLEPAFQLFRAINAAFFGGQVAPIYFAVALFCLWIKFGVIGRISDAPWLSIAIYAASFFILHEYVQIRAAAAIAIFFWAFDDFKNRRFLPVLLKTALAMCFHYSAFAMIPCYFFVHWFRGSGAYVILVFLALIFSLLDLEAIHLKTLLAEQTGWLEVVRYKVGPEVAVTFDARVFKSLHFFALLLFIPAGQGAEQTDRLLFRMFAFCLFMLYSLSVLDLPVTSTRFSEFFMPPLCILAVNTAKYYHEKWIYLVLISPYMAYRSLSILGAVRL